MQNIVTNVLMVGVGGQGIIMASDVLARTAARAGMDVKKSDVHGMAQRGGAVSSHVRFGDKVFSPLIPEGEADILFSSELLEALRRLYFLKPTARIIVSSQRIDPPDVSRGHADYPERIIEKLRERDPEMICMDSLEFAMQLGNPRTATIFLLGAVSSLLDFKQNLWKDVLREVVPREAVEVNIRAFEKGMEAGLRKR
jgi:indolepyruvate ferredoxin oxidoreductase beta subunit